MAFSLRPVLATACAIVLISGATACDSMPRKNSAAPKTTVTVVVDEPEDEETSADAPVETVTETVEETPEETTTQATPTANVAGLPTFTFSGVDNYALGQPAQGWPESAPAGCPYPGSTEVAYRDAAKNLTAIEKDGELIQIFSDAPTNILGKVRSDATQQQIMAAFPNARFSDSNAMWGGLTYDIIDPASGHTITIIQVDGKSYTGAAIKENWAGYLGDHCWYPIR